MWVRILTVSLSVAGAIALVIVNDVDVWYNVLLAFHIGVVITLLDPVLTEAYADSTSDADMAWWLAGTIVSISHLVPFALTNRLGVLTLLAIAGIGVHVALAVWLANTSKMLIVGSTSGALLAIVLLIVGKLEATPALWGLFLKSVNEGTCITCTM
jgi:hypothetical protein